MAFPLQLLHLDLFGHVRMMRLGKKRYWLINVDDFSRYTWVLFLANKDEAFHAFKTLLRKCKTKYITILPLFAPAMAKSVKVICLKHYMISIALVTNSLHLRPITNKTCYEIFKGRKPNLSYFHMFKCTRFILKSDRNQAGEFNSKANEGIFSDTQLPVKHLEFIIKELWRLRNL